MWSIFERKMQFVFYGHALWLVVIVLVYRKHAEIWMIAAMTAFLCLIFAIFKTSSDYDWYFQMEVPPFSAMQKLMFVVGSVATAIFFLTIEQKFVRFMDRPRED